MFRAVPLSIIRSFSLYTAVVYVIQVCCQQTCMTYTTAVCTVKTPDDGQRNCPKHIEFYSKNKFEKLRSVLILLASCQQTCMTYTTAVCTVKNF